jgi:hypothetical protein
MPSEPAVAPASTSSPAIARKQGAREQVRIAAADVEHRAEETAAIHQRPDAEQHASRHHGKHDGRVHGQPDHAGRQLYQGEQDETRGAGHHQQAQQAVHLPRVDPRLDVRDAAQRGPRHQHAEHERETREHPINRMHAHLPSAGPTCGSAIHTIAAAAHPPLRAAV